MQIFFFKKIIKYTTVFWPVIETACEGLVYISETDAPMLAFSGTAADAVTAETILQQAGRDRTPIEGNVNLTSFLTG